MKKLVTVLVGVLVLGFTGAAHADFVGNKDSKFFFPDTCSYVKLIKKENVVNFKTSADAIAAGYKASSKCQSNAASTVMFVGNKSSKLFFPANCSVVKLIKDDNKVSFNSSADAVAAGYKASSKCAQ
jgi:methylphosphotriester-DNA--protein-cysteine methyltransferase